MAASHIAHNIGEQSRTGDVAIQENVEFSGMLLSPAVLLGLKEAGFERPSPIQLKAIPLGRCGLDLIVQAKSGTGKTCVFSVVALEGLQMDSNSVQVLVLAPTREIAVQIWEVMTSLGRHIEGLKCHMFIGGLPVHEDKLKLKNCHIAIGSPGRIKQLIEIGAINTDSVRLFVLDEADKLLQSNFQEQINWIYSTLPENKQMLALSATYPESLAQHLTKYSRNPTFVRLNSSDPALLGIKQFFQVTPYHPMQHVVYEEKVKYLLKLLTSATFNQCLVFSNYQTRAENLCDVLNSRGWPATFISGSQEQHLRLEAMAKLKAFQCRVLVSTDLTSRGIDADKVNLVVNMDLPRDHETYLHRIGRAGRFGTYGAAVTYASKGNELELLQAIERKCNTTMRQLPDPIPNDLVKSLGYIDVSHLVTAEPLNKQTDLAAILNEHLSDTKAANSLTFENKNKIQENIDESCAYRNGHDIEEATITSVNGNGLNSELSEINSGSVCNGQSKNTIVKPKKDLTFDSRCLSNYIKEFQIPDEDATSKENAESSNGDARIEDLTTVSFKKASKSDDDKLKAQKQNDKIKEGAAKCIKATDPESKPGKYRHPYGKWSRIEKPKQEEQPGHNDVNAIENNDSGLDKGLDTGFDGNIGSRTSIQDFGSNITDCINKPEFHLNTQCSITSDIKAPFLIPPLYERIKPKPRFATFNDALENYKSFMEVSIDESCDANIKEIEIDSGVNQEKSEGMIGEQLINDVSVYLEKISLEKAHNHQINLIKKHYPNARLIQETNTRNTIANTKTTSESKSDAVQNILSHRNVENKCISEAANSDIHKDNRHRDEEAQTEKAYEEEYEDDYTESESNDSYSDDATDESNSESGTEFDESGSEFDDSGSEFDEDSENDDTSTLGDNKSAQYMNPMVYNPHPYLPYPWQSYPWQPSYYSNFAWSPWQHPNVSYPYQYSQLDWDRQIEQTYKAQSDYLKAMSK